MTDKITDYTHEEKQRALDEAWAEMNPKVETDVEWSDIEFLRKTVTRENGFTITFIDAVEGVTLEAERVGELETQCNNLQVLNNQLIFNHNEPLKKENKRLREGIEKLMVKADNCDSDFRDMDASSVFSELYDLLGVSE